MNTRLASLLLLAALTLALLALRPAGLRPPSSSPIAAEAASPSASSPAAASAASPAPIGPAPSAEQRGSGAAQEAKRDRSRTEQAYDSEAEEGEAALGEELGAPPLVDRPPHKDDGTPLEILTRRSLALVLELNGRGAALRRSAPKDLPYRRNNRRAIGRYAFQVQDRDGRELFTGGFDAPELCPLSGAGHDAPHQNGHVFLEHSSSVLLRVPRFPAGARLAIYRNIPTIDPEPSLLATLPLD